MAGGLASLPGFGWVPLKVYRPCPELAKAGISYVRRASGVVLTCAIRFMLQRVSAYVVEGRLSRTLKLACSLSAYVDGIMKTC